MGDHHRHRIASSAAIIGIFVIIGFWLFSERTILPSNKEFISLTGPDGKHGSLLNITVFPNSTAVANLTISMPARSSLRVSGIGTDLSIALGGRAILSSSGQLAGDEYIITSAEPTTLSLDDEPDEDQNNNSIPDMYERRHNLFPLKMDPDRDNVTTLQEYAYYRSTGREINPLLADTDGDGISDGEEVHIGTNPVDASDKPIHAFASQPWFFTFTDLFSNPNLLAMWSFDAKGHEALGAHPLTLLENATVAIGPFGQGLNATYSSQGALGSRSSVFSQRPTFTLSAWVVTSDNRSRYIFSIPTLEGLPGITMDYGSSYPACAVTIRNTTYEAKSHTFRILSDSRPHQITCVKTNASLKVYVDAKEEDAIDVPPGMPEASGSIHIGNHNGGNQFSGIIDTILFYQNPLSAQEISQDFNRFHAGMDMDGDGISDDWEDRHGLSSRVSSDAARDDDQDGLTNQEEYHYFLLTDREINPKSADTDKDGYSDLAEVRQGSDPTDATEKPGYDRDRFRDQNYDGIPDYWELAFGLSIINPVGNQDPDHDGITNLQEYSYVAATGRLISPTMADSDGDGAGDKDEILKGSDPSGTLSMKVNLHLPSRFTIEIPSHALLSKAAIMVSEPVNFTPTDHDQSRREPRGQASSGIEPSGIEPSGKDPIGEEPREARGLVDISSLLSTDCGEKTWCRNTILAAGPDQVTISGIDIRYSIQPSISDPIPLCPDYPCTFPLSIRSSTPGFVNLQLGHEPSAPCENECQQLASLKCPDDVSCTAGGKEYGRRIEKASGSTTTSNETVSIAKTPLPKTPIPLTGNSVMDVSPKESKGNPRRDDLWKRAGLFLMLAAGSALIGVGIALSLGKMKRDEA